MSSLSHQDLTMTPCIGQTNNDATHYTMKYVFHQTPNRHYHWPETCHAVWRMARLESRRRARQAAIPPRVSARSLRTEDTRMRLLSSSQELLLLHGAGTPRTEASQQGEEKKPNTGFPQQQRANREQSKPNPPRKLGGDVGLRARLPLRWLS